MIMKFASDLRKPDRPYVLVPTLNVLVFVDDFRATNDFRYEKGMFHALTYFFKFTSIWCHISHEYALLVCTFDVVFSHL